MEEFSTPPEEEGIVDALNRKIADLHMQLEASDMAVRHLEQNKKKGGGGSKKLKKGFSLRKGIKTKYSVDL